VDNVCVREDQRRSGVATSLVAAACDVARTYGTGRVWAHVHAQNHAARRLYARYGFAAAVQLDQARQESLGLLLLCAPLPLKRRPMGRRAALAGTPECDCGALLGLKCVCSGLE
jgi:L-amino acid N-acyltransferase YncA